MKQTSPLIVTPNVLELENKIKTTKHSLYYKLCGAGGGGYLLLIKKKTDDISEFGLLRENSYIDITVDNRGIKTWQLN